MNLRTPTLKGLQKPDLYFGVDIRVLFACVIIALFGAPFPPLLIVAGLVYVVGLVLAGYSPHAIADTARFMAWRMQARSGIIPDEGATANARVYSAGRKP